MGMEESKHRREMEDLGVSAYLKSRFYAYTRTGVLPGSAGGIFLFLALDLDFDGY